MISRKILTVFGNLKEELFGYLDAVSDEAKPLWVSYRI
jgi:hypothetical protein